MTLVGDGIASLTALSAKCNNYYSHDSQFPFDSMLDSQLSRRERQIMEALYALGSAGAREVAQRIGEPEALESVRVTLIGLEKKRIVRHRLDGRRHIYTASKPRDKASAAALTSVTATFFGGSAKKALVALLDLGRNELSERDLDELEQWVRERTRERKRK